MAGSQAFVHVLPLDAWVSGTGDDGSWLVSGRPLGDGNQLLRVVTGDGVRLGTVAGQAVSHAVELRFSQHVGEIALAEPDGAGGYLAVVRTWRAGTNPADQFQVVRLGPGGSVRTFALPRAEYAAVPPASRFRLGRDGALYQMTSSPAGMRIVRYDLGRQA